MRKKAQTQRTVRSRSFVKLVTSSIQHVQNDSITKYNRLITRGVERTYRYLLNYVDNHIVTNEKTSMKLLDISRLMLKSLVKMQPTPVWTINVWRKTIIAFHELVHLFDWRYQKLVAEVGETKRVNANIFRNFFRTRASRATIEYKLVVSSTQHFMSLIRTVNRIMVPTEYAKCI